MSWVAAIGDSLVRRTDSNRSAVASRDVALKSAADASAICERARSLRFSDVIGCSFRRLIEDVRGDAQRSSPPMTGGWAVAGLAVVGLSGHSVGCLVSLLDCALSYRPEELCEGVVGLLRLP